MQPWFQVLIGIVVGIATARLHLALSRRAMVRVLHDHRLGGALVGFPVRVAIPAVVLFFLGAWGWPALVAGLAAFAGAHRWWLSRLIAPEDPE